MKLPFLAPVTPPHVFCLVEDGVTYARVRRDGQPGFEEARHFRYPGAAAAGKEGAPGIEMPLITPEAIAEAVKAARALSGGRLTRASVLFPDAWARVLAVEVETPVTDDQAGTDMLLWKLKKLLPQATGELALLHRAMPALDGENRELVVAAPRQTIDAIERSFAELGVRVGYLAPASVALFEGLSRTFAAAASGDYAVLHRTDRALSFLIGRGEQPIFFRQRPPEEDEDHDREARLSFSYYVERLRGPGLSAVFVHDERRGGTLENLAAFPVKAVRVSGRLFDADASFDERVAARPELLAGFAAVYGRR